MRSLAIYSAKETSPRSPLNRVEFAFAPRLKNPCYGKHTAAEQAVTILPAVTSSKLEFQLRNDQLPQHHHHHHLNLSFSFSIFAIQRYEYIL